MDLPFLPSLQQAAAMSIAIHSWTSDDMKEINNKSFKSFDRRCEMFTISFTRRFTKGFIQDLKCTEAYEKVEKKLSNLMNQRQMMKKFGPLIKSAITSIGFEIARLVKNYQYLWFDLAHHLHWTSYGTINRSQLSLLVVENQNIDTLYRYELACESCLDQKMPELLKKLIAEEGGIRFVGKICEKAPRVESLATYWTLYFTSENVPSTVNAFNIALKNGNAEAAKYFFQRLLPEEWPSDLILKITIAGFKEQWDVFCSLLQELPETEQIELIRRNPADYLLLFLEWPWQDFFLKMFKKVLEFFHPDNFVHVLLKVAETIEADPITDRRIFSECWLLSSREFKRWLLSTNTLSMIFKILYLIRDIEDIHLMLLSGEFGNEVREYCKCFSCESERDKFEFMVNRCSSCQERICKFKKSYLFSEHGIKFIISVFGSSNWSEIERIFLNGLKTQEELLEFKAFFESKVDDNFVLEKMKNGQLDLLDRMNSWCVNEKFCTSEK